jgi:hypothetical protein
MDGSAARKGGGRAEALTPRLVLTAPQSRDGTKPKGMSGWLRGLVRRT